MNSRERFLRALSNQVPDRVPVTPDTSNYIPAKRTGLPFWEIYFKGSVPLWKAYLETADHFGFDPWNCSSWGPGFVHEDVGAEWKSQDAFDASQDAMIRRTRVRSRLGELTSAQLCFRSDPPSPIEKPIKDLARDLPVWLAAQSMPRALNSASVDAMRAECRKRECAFGMGIGYPGFHSWMGAVEGGIEPLAIASLEAPELLDQWFEWDLAAGTRAMELILAAKPDYVNFGGSGTITLSSPDLAMKYAIPALKRWSGMCRAAGVPTLLHSCGKSRILVDMLADETDVTCLNPLEIPPMGDVDLAEVKRARGKRMALMGNLHTTNVMLRGSADDVRRESLRAMRAAGTGGGFILSTGDQCPRDTPDENLFAMVETAVKFGRYDQQTGTLPDLPDL